jgi:hypothetical protein
MKLTRKTYTSRSEKITDFVMGFVGWLLLNTLSGLISLVPLLGWPGAGRSAWASDQPLLGVLPLLPLVGADACLVYPAWVVTLAVVFRWRRWLALGGATAFGLTFGYLAFAFNQIMSGWQ